jgi:hypothetical protein
MSDEVRYQEDTDEFNVRRRLERPKKSFLDLSDFLLSHGYAYDRNAAENLSNKILLGVAITAILIAIALPFFFLNGSKPKPPVPSIDGTYPQQP